MESFFISQNILMKFMTDYFPRQYKLNGKNQDNICIPIDAIRNVPAKCITAHSQKSPFNFIQKTNVAQYHLLKPFWSIYVSKFTHSLYIKHIHSFLCTYVRVPQHTYTFMVFMYELPQTCIPVRAVSKQSKESFLIKVNSSIKNTRKKYFAHQCE